ncbi:MAG: DUF5106 domain-containing protein [Porphyromonadaceae bacterium]|nr:DUF5106 domain-containing protein [Porphyromonadaceae bacterium]
MIKPLATCLSTMLMVLGTLSCATRTAEQTSDSSRDASVASARHPQEPEPLDRPTPPLHLQTPEERAEYVLNHFWDKMDFADTALIKHPAMEFAFADYCGLLTSFPADRVEEALLRPLDRSEGSMLIFALSMYRMMLYEANSPIMSEAHYRTILKWAIRSPKVEAAYQEQARLVLELIDKNSVGSQATDFIYTTVEQTQRHLKHQKATRTLLVFATPDCPTCSRTLEELQKTPIIAESINSGRLGVLVIYLQSTQEQFVQAASKLPNYYEVGYDAQDKVVSEQLYDIKASPTMYLLERGGKVLIKDATIERMAQYLLDYSN